MPIGMQTVKKAIVAMTGVEGGRNSTPPALAMDIEYELDKNGEPDTEKVIYMNPTKWEDWIKLPVRSWDFCISTITKQIRVPTVIIEAHFKDMPLKKARCTKYNIAERDQWRCQYSNQKLTKSTMTIDHVIPRSRGGNNHWTNVVTCHKDINLKKGNKLNSEINYKLIKKPTEPMPQTISSSIKEIRHVDWQHFVFN